MKILSVKKATENPFLNMYDVEFEDRLGNRRVKLFMTFFIMYLSLFK